MKGKHFTIKQIKKKENEEMQFDVLLKALLAVPHKRKKEKQAKKSKK